jgi:DNA-binding Xre family transcriptional regulator
MHRLLVPRGTVLTNYITNPYLCMQMEELAKRIIAWMAYRKMSQGDLSRASGILQPRISKVLGGKQKSVHPKTLRRIAEALEIDPSDLDRYPPGVDEMYPKRGSIDLEELFKYPNVTYNGEWLSEDDKERIKLALRAALYRGKNASGGKDVKTGT